MEKIKRAIPLILLSALLITLMLVPVSAEFAANGTDAVDFEVVEGLPWVNAAASDQIYASNSGTEKTNVLDSTHISAIKAGNCGVPGDSGVSYTMTYSTVKFTVTSKGLLSFDFIVNGMPGIKGTFLGCSINEAPSAYDDYKSNANYGNAAFYERHGWQTHSLKIGDEMLVNGKCDIYFTFFVRTQHATNYAALSNVKFESGAPRTNLVQGDYASMGTVTVSSKSQKTEEYKDNEGNQKTRMVDVYNPIDTAFTQGIPIGDTVYITATPKEGYEFYGWTKHYSNVNGVMVTTYVAQSENVELKVNSSDYLVPIFAEAGTYTARVGNQFYDENDDIASLINETDNGVIVLFGEAELKSDATVSKYATLYVSYHRGWTNDENNGVYRALGYKTVTVPLSDPTDASKCCGKLTVPAGVTLTVNGTLVTGGEIGMAGMEDLQSGTTGAFGLIENNGSIVLNGSAKLTTYGYITGSGTLLAKNGSTVKEPFIIADYAGGNNSANLYYAGQFPFKRYAFQNIQCTFTMNRGGTLTGMCDLYAMSCHNEVDIVIYSPDASKALFVPNGTISGEETMFTRTLDFSKALTTSSALGSSAIALATWDIYGGINFCCGTLKVVGIKLSLNGVAFPIPYNFNYSFNSGTYSIPGSIEILPGAVVNVAEDANITIDGSLTVLDGLKQTGMSGKAYPTSEELKNSGYSAAGTLIVNGTLNIKDGSTFGGIVQTTGTTGKLVIGKDCKLVNSGNLDALADTDVLAKTANGIKQDGAIGYYDDNTTWFNLPARVYNGTEFVQLVSDTTYQAAGATAFTLPDYTVRYSSESTFEKGKLISRVMTKETVTIDQAMTGVWTDSTATVPVSSDIKGGGTGTLNADLVVNTLIQKDVNGGTDNILTVEFTTKDNGTPKMRHVALVKYSAAGEADTVVKANADGSYTIPDRATNVTVQVGMVGDINGDGKITTTDISQIKRIYFNKLSPSDLQKLVADNSKDGKVTTTDISRLKRLYFGKITNFY